MRRLSSTTSTADHRDDSGPRDDGTTTEGVDGSGSGGSGSNNSNRSSDSEWIPVCGMSDVSADGQMFKYEDQKILVANHGGKIHATDLMCTHADADLSCGFMGPDGIRCPLHLSVFDLESGAPQNPPAEKPLRVYNVKVRDGQVLVGGVTR